MAATIAPMLLVESLATGAPRATGVFAAAPIALFGLTGWATRPSALEPTAA